MRRHSGVDSSQSGFFRQVQGWARKAGACGFHLIPVPIDPFALPWTPSSDPLRGPIFVPLNLSCLIDDTTRTLFQGKFTVATEKKANQCVSKSTRFKLFIRCL